MTKGEGKRKKNVLPVKMQKTNSLSSTYQPQENTINN